MVEKNIYLSIISPVYMADEIVNQLIIRVSEEAIKITDDFEIILVDDGSSDQSWEKIKENCLVNNKIKGIKLSRNFGQHYAITAGLKESKGDCVVVMDCDLQDNPKYISELINTSLNGFDIVLTTHKMKHQNRFKLFFSKAYYFLFNSLVVNKQYVSGATFTTLSLLKRNVVNAFCEYNDYHRQYLSIIRWLGFSKTAIPVIREKRFKGKTSYSIIKLIKLAIDSIVSQTEKLLHVTIYIGFGFAVIGFISVLFIVYMAIKYGFQSGWASISVLIIFSAGLILMSIGVIGIYIGKMFEQTKGRPLYLIEEMINFK